MVASRHTRKGRRFSHVRYTELAKKHDSDPDRVAEELGEQSAYEDATDMKRRIRRGNEAEGDADDRDVAGDYSKKSPSDADLGRDQGLGRRRVPS